MTKLKNEIDEEWFEEPKKGKNTRRKILLITISIIIMIVVIFTIVQHNKKNILERVSTIRYVSVSEEKNCTYARFDIETNLEFGIVADDFAVLIDGYPVTAKGIVNGISSTMTPNGLNNAYIIGSQTIITNSRQVLVCFSYTLVELDSPLTFLYKGQQLKLGEFLKI